MCIRDRLICNRVETIENACSDVVDVRHGRGIELAPVPPNVIEFKVFHTFDFSGLDGDQRGALRSGLGALAALEIPWVHDPRVGVDDLAAVYVAEPPVVVALP